jgi:predicted ATP-grasp superfamily ATP-dependent carboligase
MSCGETIFRESPVKNREETLLSDLSKMNDLTLVILGSTQTALAVVRNAHRLKIKPIVFDITHGIATKSSLTESVVVASNPESELLSRLTQLVKDESTYLIATGDEWLEFLVQYRTQLDGVFSKILHPPNEVLCICLQKRNFSMWCTQNDIPTPKIFTMEELDTNKDLLNFPLFIRPIKTHHTESHLKIPKALEIYNEKELEYWLDYYVSSGVEPLISESLLNQNLIQYSIAAARVGEQCISFVAEKKRPLAEACAVGTYVELCTNDTVETVARNVLERLDYQGIAEVEILHSLDTGSNYVIEINARPWLQYTLSFAAGYDFLGFLIRPDIDYFPKTKFKEKYWIDFVNDFYTCFAKHGGLVRHRKIGILDYIKSLLKANVYAKFDVRDLRPCLSDLRELVRIVTGK